MSPVDGAGPPTASTLVEAARYLLSSAEERGLSVAVAESLTGGEVSSVLVSVPGASTVVVGGVVAYATRIKAEILGVDVRRLELTGPVDGEVAKQMANGVAALLGADLGLATTGVAGPGPAAGVQGQCTWRLPRRGGRSHASSTWTETARRCATGRRRRSSPWLWRCSTPPGPRSAAGPHGRAESDIQVLPRLLGFDEAIADERLPLRGGNETPQ